MINKITPTHTVCWYTKWIASVFIIIGVLLSSNNIFPYNLMFHFIGLVGWLIVAIIWHDRALLVINSVSLAILGNGIIQYYVK
tara:strand:- start:855 stop:1103 length:249 start_codon:yes stop_codon:yes gene_type:complete